MRKFEKKLFSKLKNKIISEGLIVFEIKMTVNMNNTLWLPQ